MNGHSSITPRLLVYRMRREHWFIKLCEIDGTKHTHEKNNLPDLRKSIRTLLFKCGLIVGILLRHA